MSNNAYLILGHGAEGPKTGDRVPPGCTLVVEVHPGLLNFRNFIDKYINNFEQNIYLDPIKNIDKILFHHKSVAIYKEGDIYPNFQYRLLSDFEEPTENVVPTGNYTLGASGLVNWPFNNAASVPDVFVEAKSASALGNIPPLYEKSSFPYKYQMMKAILDLGYTQNRNPCDITVSEFLTAANFSYTQKQLFTLVGSGHLKPGIFYNPVCRFDTQIKYSLYKVPQNTTGELIGTKHREYNAKRGTRRLNVFATKNEAGRLEAIKELNESLQRSSLNNKGIKRQLRQRWLNRSGQLKGRPNTETRRVIKEQIAETVAHRVPYRHMAYLKEQFFKETHNNDNSYITDKNILREVVSKYRQAGFPMKQQLYDALLAMPLYKDLAEVILENEAISLDDIIEEGNKPYGRLIHHAVRDFYHPGLITFLVNHGADVNALDEDGYAAIHLSTKNRNMHVSDEFAEYEAANADLNIKVDDSVHDHGYENGATPLHLAIMNKYIVFAILLLLRGADLNATNSAGWTPLITAIYYDRPEIAKMLLQKNVDITYETYSGESAITAAIDKSNYQIIESLLAKGIDINEASISWQSDLNTDATNITPLSYAVLSKVVKDKLGVILLLINRGADKNIRDKSGKTALDYAKEEGNADVIEALEYQSGGRSRRTRKRRR